nr:uncharacterized protein LOC128686743 isoform X1 [Cherax quadricarinatus]
MSSETESSIDCLDSSLVYLKIGESTLEELAHSLIKCTENDEFCSADYQQQQQDNSQINGDLEKNECAELGGNGSQLDNSTTSLKVTQGPSATSQLPLDANFNYTCAGKNVNTIKHTYTGKMIPQANAYVYDGNKVNADANTYTCAGKTLLNTEVNNNNARCEKCDTRNNNSTDILTATNNTNEQFNEISTSMRDSSKSKQNCDANEASSSNLNKVWSPSTQDLSRTVDKILRTCGGLGEGQRKYDLSYMGVSEALGEMLLQHGEFPATPLVTPTPRYRSTPLDTAQAKRETAVDFKNGTIFGSSLSSSQSLQYKPHLQELGEVTFSLAPGGDHLSSAPHMMTTPEEPFTGATPRLNLGCQQTPPGSLPSIMSWGGSEAEGAWPAISPFFSSLGSVSLATSNTHSEAPSFPLPQMNEIPHGKRQEMFSTQYQDWPEARTTRHSYLAQHHSVLSQYNPSQAQHHTSYPQQHTSSSQHYHLQAQRHPQTVYQTLCTDKAVVGGMAPGAAASGVSPRRALIQDVVLRESTRAFRSHPLFPLLKDLAVTDYYFDKANFNVAPLLSFLPPSTEDLVTLYLRRNPEAAQAYQNKHASPRTQTIDAVIFDAVTYAHASLMKRVVTQVTKLSEVMEAEPAEVEEAVEDLCQRYIEVVRSSTPLHLIHAFDTSSQASPQQQQSASQCAASVEVGEAERGVREPFQQLEHLLAPFSPIPHSCNTQDSSETRRRRSCHSREVYQMLSSWLFDHHHHPYPDDDQKVFLMQQTGLSAQQINQWFINARRRLLPRLKAEQGKE